MRNKMFSVLLVITFILNSLFDCFAATQVGNNKGNSIYLSDQIKGCKTVIEYSADTTVDKMQTVIFGSYPQNEDPEVDVLDAKKDPIEWVVLEKSNDVAFLLSKNILTVKEFSNVGDNKYRNSEIRKWLNDEFLNLAFNQEENNMIMTSEVNVRNSNGDVYDVVNDKIFILGNNEMNQYFPQLGKSMLPLPTEYSTGGPENYLRDQSLYDGVIIAHPSIIEEGYSGSTYYDFDNDKWVLGDASIGLMKKEELWAPTGVRPAIWVKLSNQNNEVANTNNAIIESANKNTNQNTLNDNHFDENLSAQILKARVITDYNKDDTISNVDTIKFGLYEQEPSRDGSNNVKETIEWIVLDKQGNKALLLSKFILDCQCYDMQNRAITWENSTLRNWLNTTFLNDAFNSNEQRYINITNVKNNSNAEYGNNTEDKLFCLSIDEVEKYFNHLSIQKINKKLSTRGTMNAKSKKGGLELLVSHSGWQSGNSPFWLRSSRGSHNWATAVSSQGMLIEGAMTGYLEYGVRPAMWVSYNPNVERSNVNNFNETNSTTNTDNSVLGDNVHIEGADVIQNPDGSIQIGGTLQEGAKIIQKGSDDNDTQYETQDEIDRIISDSNEATLKKPIDRVYYYAKHDVTNKTVTSINKKNSSNGLLGTGLFSNKTYYNIEIKFNEDTKKRLSKYAELEWNGSYKSGQDWILLAGNTMNDLENVSWFGITPFKDNDRVANTKELSYYQKGTLQVHSLSANEQNRVYNKLKNAKVIVLATHNVIKDDRIVFSEEEKLGNVERFEYVKDDGSHINLVNAYIDCEEKVVEYTNDHNGYFLYVKDGFTGDLAYHEEIVAPKKKCNKFDILVFGNDSLSYSIYGNKVNFLAGKEVGGLKKFQVFGGKMDWIFELNTKDGFEDYEKYYLENKDKW